MIRRALLVLTILLLGATVVQAQCVNNKPCGPVPWTLPQLPTLVTPTPFPTVLVTSASGNVPTPTGTLTATPTPTGTLGLDTGAISEQMGTLQSVMEATPEVILNRAQGFDLAGNALMIFNYVLGLQTIHFGIFTPLIQFIFFGLFFVIAVKFSGYLLPIIATLVGLLRKLVQLVLDFIPG